MKATLIALLSVALFGLSCLPVSAQPAGRPNDPPGADAAKTAQLRTEIHQAMSALNAAKKAQDVDQAQIKELTDRLTTLRAQMWANAPLGKQAGGCPWGGPGQGPNGMGMGPGAGRGPGAGQGRGMGMGRGPMAGPNAGAGQGRGRGPGAGKGPGVACPGCPGCLGCPNCPAGQGCQGQGRNCPWAGNQNQAAAAPGAGAGRRGQGRGPGGPR